MRLAVLASGSGTLLESILASPVEVSLVIVDRPCRAIEVAADAGIEAALVERKDWSSTFDRAGYAQELLDVVEKSGISWMAMAGFGTILAPQVFEAFPGRIVNTHPALLPSFPGWHAVRDALSAGVKITGCTVHVATPTVDDGPILAQEAVPVFGADDEASLHERIKVVERRLYPETLHRIVRSGEILGQQI